MKRRRRAVKYIDKADFQISNSCVAFGNFDGVHIGHRAVIKKLLETSKRDTTSVLLCFDHVEKERFLSTTEEKIELLGEDKPDVFISYRSENTEMECFVKEVLIDKLGAKAVVVGKNNPDIGILRESAKKYGFFLEECDEVTVDGEAVTSERIKKELFEGSLEKANELLGHPYLMIGEVMHGKALGRTVGMPTANLGVGENKLMPRHAVYASLSIIDGESYKGLTNIGLRPSVDSFQYATIETFLLDFSNDVYGKKIKLEIQMLIREIQKFDSLDEVKQQVGRDLEFVKKHVKDF
jgi:riboflavin kinase / FMN adenylyltransferase